MKKTVLICSVLWSFAATAQAPDFAWVNKSSGLTNPQVSTSINSHFTVVDSVNQFIYCLSGFENSIDFGNGEHEGPAIGQPNAYLVKYTLDGALVWDKHFYSNYGNAPSGMTIDGSGNLIICGNTVSDTLRINNQYLLNGTPDNSDHVLTYIAKLDGNGNTLWLVGSSADGGSMSTQAIAVDASNNVYATGVINDPTGTYIGNPVSAGFFVIKLNTSGVSQWFKQSSSVNLSQGNAITIDHNGDCIVAGSHINQFDLGAFTVPFNDGSTYLDRFLTKLTAVNGTFLWANSTGVWQGPEQPHSIQTDAQNNIYVSGLDTYAGDPMSSTSNDVEFLEKRDQNGMLVWYKSFEAYALNTLFPTLITDHVTTSAGETYALFIVNDSTDFDGAIASSLPANFNSSIVAVVAKYATDGTLDWLKQTTDNAFLSYSAGYSISLDQSENIYFTGMLSSSINFDNILAATSDPNYKEFFLAKLGNVPLAVTETGAEEMILYPNPSHHLLTIMGVNDALYTIYDINGSELQHGQISQSVISLSTLPQGVYQVKVHTATGIKQARFVKLTD